MKPRRCLSRALLLSVVWLAACGKSEPPPPAPAPAAPPAPKAEAPKAAPAPDVNAETKQLAGELYVYAYPLVLTDVTRQANAANAPPNTFAHRRTVADATTADGANPNADFLYSQAWLDLAQGPVILSVPDTKGRYYLIALLDAWSNVATSIGKRTTGTEKREFAIVGPRWKGTLPADVTEIKSPTDMAWLFARVPVNGKGDRAAAAKVQEQLKVTPLAQRTKGGAKGAGAGPRSPADAKADPREQVARMSAAAFFTRFAALLAGNPPARDDAPMLAKIKKLGIVAGQPFAVTDPAVAASIDQGMQLARDAMVAGTKGNGGADIRNGWVIDRALGRWGTDYGRRAVAAMNGLGVNAPEDAIAMAARFDAGGHRFDGANNYVLHFDKDASPPADAFWSLSLYDDNKRFVANPQNRNSIASVDGVKANADGSVDLYIQNADPGKDKEANWLPAPKGPFNLILRVYWPKQEVVDGHWIAPGARRAP
ncbi:MAG: DUF1254 domain-containing protein [Casimicrobiaceae bacterium]